MAIDSWAMGILLATAAPITDATVNRPVRALALKRYAGYWHQIAHLPMFSRRKCVGDITASYRLNEDGTVGVRNACRTKSGKRSVSEGLARPVPGRPGALQVCFAPDWLAWLPVAWTEYWVIDLDPDYRWAVVGGPGRKSLSILSRTSSMPLVLFERIKAGASARGYDLDALVVASSQDRQGDQLH